jgi:hypothetical protein
MNKQQCASEIPAVQRCLRARQDAYDKKMNNLAKGETDFEARCAGREAYLCALPPLSGYENIRDYIACVMHALVIHAADPDDVENYLKGAKVALSVLRQKPKRQRRQQDTPEKSGKNKKKTS